MLTGLSIKGSPFVRFVLNEIPQSADDSVPLVRQLSVYKLALAPKSLSYEESHSPAFWLQQIKANQVAPTADVFWTLIMFGSGHFAGAVINCRTGKPVAHKTFHRYTTRRKQGGAQSSNDSSKGKANSAGAGLRRYNEAALQAEVVELITSWKSHIASSQLLFIRATGVNRSTLYFDKTILDAKDPRIRTFPFTTRRPTLSELTRCFEDLATVRIDVVARVQPQASTGIATTDADIAAESRSGLSHPQPEPEPPKEPESLSPIMVKLVDMCKRGKHQLMKRNMNAADIDVNTRLPDKFGISFLHIASSNGQAETVKALLEDGADPTMQGLTRKARAFDVANSKEVRDAFRSMSPEARARLDREKRALAAEARMNSQQNKCCACGRSLVDVTPFNKLQFSYCSIDCVK
eukprot:jgi/Hompol1/6923/HPOL_005125-RA